MFRSRRNARLDPKDAADIYDIYLRSLKLNITLWRNTEKDWGNELNAE